MKKSKQYDAVAEVRKFRDKMGPIYMKDPERLKKDLKKARDVFFPKEWDRNWVNPKAGLQLDQYSREKADVLKEIREAREKISVEFFNNPEKMFETMDAVYHKRLRDEAKEKKKHV